MTTTDPVTCPVCGAAFQYLAGVWVHLGKDYEGCGTRVLELARREAELMRPHGRH